MGFRHEKRRYTAGGGPLERLVRPLACRCDALSLIQKQVHAAGIDNCMIRRQEIDPEDVKGHLSNADFAFVGLEGANRKLPYDSGFQRTLPMPHSFSAHHSIYQHHSDVRCKLLVDDSAEGSCFDCDNRCSSVYLAINFGMSSSVEAHRNTNITTTK